MKPAAAGIGGPGIKLFRMVFLFKAPPAFDKFNMVSRPAPRPMPARGETAGRREDARRRIFTGDS